MSLGNPFPWNADGEAWPSVDGRWIAASAKAWANTPFALHQRSWGAGVDCFGLLVGCLADLGIKVEDQAGYTGLDEMDWLLEALSEFSDEVSIQDRQQGDFLVFRHEQHLELTKIYNHVAVLTLDASGVESMVHATPKPSSFKVVEHPLDDFWLPALVRVFRYRGTV